MRRLIIFAVALLCFSCTKKCSGLNHDGTSRKAEESTPTSQSRPQPKDDEGDRTHQEPTAFFWPDRVGAVPTAHEEPGPNYRQYYNSVYRQMIDIPRESDRALSQALLGAPPEPPAGAARLIPLSSPEPGLNSFGFTGYASRMFWPDKAPAYVAFASEGACCDLIRGRYVLPEYVVDVASSRYVVMVRITGLEESNQPPLLQVADFARAFFSSSAKDLGGASIEFHWLQINATDGRDPQAPAYGCHDVRKKKHSRHDHWADNMNWWLRPGEIGFISSKGQGVMTRDFPSISPEYNKEWFSLGR